MCPYIRQMRIKSWLKNLFVISPIVFSLELFQWDKLSKTILLTIAFCLISSAVYTFNDIRDVENDRRHDIKKHRPIASGEIPLGKAWILSGVLAAAGLCLAFGVNWLSGLYILVYVGINILYSGWLKRKALIDCFCIAAGFVLRVMVGGTIAGEGVSGWMFLTVVSLSLFMAFGKRRGELFAHEGKQTREVLNGYDAAFLDGIIFMTSGLMMVFYSLWTISQHTRLVYTVPIVLFIVMRYLLLVFKGQAEGDPTSLILSDKTLLIAGACWGLVMMLLLYII